MSILKNDEYLASVVIPKYPEYKVGFPDREVVEASHTEWFPIKWDTENDTLSQVDDVENATCRHKTVLAWKKIESK